MTGRSLALAFSPFTVRNYRFQWSGDLLTSWAFEMETVLLGWFIVVQTGSVLYVTLFGAIQFIGTLLAPFIGVVGDKVGARNILCMIRGALVVLSALGAALTAADLLTPVWVLAITGLAGLVRPSDTGVRNVLIAETMPSDRLMQAIPLSRITMDSARVAGALSGGVLTLGLGLKTAYMGVVLFYALGVALTLCVRTPRPTASKTKTAPLRDLREAMRAVWQAPAQLAAMLMAFVVNVTAYPFTLGLLPYVARDVYGGTQASLGYLVAAVAGGGVIGSLVVTLMGRSVRPARTVMAWSVIWHGLVILFGQTATLKGGLLVLVFVGVAQMICLMPMSVLLLRGAPTELRGRIMGIRTLAVYGLPLGLLGSGPAIDRFGFAATAGLYGFAGIAATLAVLLVFRSHLWPRDAAANEGR